MSVTKQDRSLKNIKAKSHCRLLGVNISENANWNYQLEGGEKSLIPALRSVTGIIVHVGKFMSEKSRLLLASGLFMSQLIYCIQLWGGLTVRQERKFQILMNSCARKVTGMSRKTRTRTLMTQCRWLYFKELVNYHSCILLWRLVRQGVLRVLAEKFILDEDSRVMELTGRILTSRRSFRWRVSDVFNKLPQEIREICSLNPFKKKLKEFLISQREDIAPRQRVVNWD